MEDWRMDREGKPKKIKNGELSLLDVFPRSKNKKER